MYNHMSFGKEDVCLDGCVGCEPRIKFAHMFLVTQDCQFSYDYNTNLFTRIVINYSGSLAAKKIC